MTQMTSHQIALFLSLIMAVCVLFYIATLIMMSVTNGRVYKIWKSMEGLSKRQNEVETTMLNSLSELKKLIETLSTK